MIRLNSPRIKDLGLEFFVTHSLRLEHLCDHVLTTPEALVWFLLFDSYGQLNPTDEERVMQYAMQLWGEPPYPRTAESLYESYTEKLEEAIREALKRAWVWRAQDRDGRPLSRGLSWHGIYVMWDDDFVRTGMVVAFAAKPPKPAPTLQERAKNPLPRKGSWVPPRAWSGPGGALVPNLSNPAQVDRSQWFFKCFRHGVRTLRQEQDVALSKGVLLHRLPNSDELEDDITFDEWKTMRPELARIARGAHV